MKLHYSILAGALFLGGCSFSGLEILQDCPIACTDGKGNIHVAEKYASQWETNPDMVAFLYAHEIAHNALGHRHSLFGPNEIEADLWAEGVVTVFGFSPCKVIPVLLEFEQFDRAARLAKRNSCLLGRGINS